MKKTAIIRLSLRTFWTDPKVQDIMCTFFFFFFFAQTQEGLKDGLMEGCAEMAGFLPSAGPSPYAL